MRNLYDLKFDHSDVMEYHLKDKFKQIPAMKLINFISRITASETWILDKWRRYFKSMGIPYAVCRYSQQKTCGDGRKRTYNHYMLWKEARVSN